MQDTSSFEAYRNQFNQLNLNNLLDQRESVREPYRTFIEDTFGKLTDYFTDEEFRKTLSITRKNNIEGQINNIIGQFNNLQSWQNDGSISISGNIDSTYINVSSYVDDLDTRFTVPRQLYKIQVAGNIDAIVQDVSNKAEEAINQANQSAEIAANAATSTRSTLAATEELVGTFGSQKLANYYQNLANGRTVNAQQDYITLPKNPIPLKWFYRLYIPSILVLFFVVLGLLQFLKVLNPNFEQIITVVISIGLPTVILALFVAINALNRHYPGGYARSSVLWMIGAIIATLGTAVYASILVFQMGSSAGWAEIIPKIVGLLAPAYLIRFCVQNYKANRHLEVNNTHRATVAKIIRPYTKLINEENPNFEQDRIKSRNNLFEAAAIILFSQSETGYLTTKEGAGGSDDMLDGFRKVS